MKKIVIKIIFLISLIFILSNTYVLGVDFDSISSATDKIKEVSISTGTGTLEEQLNSKTENVFKTAKIVIGGLLVIYLVYSGTMMIISMGRNEEQLSDAKKSTWYVLVALIFINIPGTLYDAFSGKGTIDDVTVTLGNTDSAIFSRNIFMNSGTFGNVLGDLIVFLQISISAFAIFMIVYSGIRIIITSSNEERVAESKNKVIWSIFGLIFIGMIEVWKRVIFSGNLTREGEGQSFKDLFETLADMALFFAGPTAIFFISLAGYYYITSAGNEDRINKAKTMIFSTVVATLILLGIYSILKDLQTFTLPS